MNCEHCKNSAEDQPHKADYMIVDGERPDDYTYSCVEHLGMMISDKPVNKVFHLEGIHVGVDCCSLAVSTLPVASAPEETLKMIAGWFHTGANREQGLSAEICRVQESQLLEIIAALSPAQAAPANFVSDYSLPSCHVCGSQMIGLCPDCKATTACETAAQAVAGDNIAIERKALAKLIDEQVSPKVLNIVTTAFLELRKK